MEEWEKINGFANYSVSNKGNVRNDLTGKILKGVMDDKGFLVVTLYGEEKKTVSIHKLVAEAFIPYFERKRTVLHIDGDRTNNKTSNLKWTSHKAHRTYKPIIASKDGIDQIFKSQLECAEVLQLKQPHVSMCLSGKRKRSHGYTFRYL